MSIEFVGDFPDDFTRAHDGTADIPDGSARASDGEADIPVFPIRAWVWIGFGIAALGVLTFTAAAGIAAPVLCMAFCAQEAFNAEVVRNAHPKPAHGRIIGRFHIAYGLWKTSVAAFLTIFVILAMHGVAASGDFKGPIGWFNRVARDQGIPLVFTFLTGFSLSAGFVIVATVGAVRHGARVWLGTLKNQVRILFWWTVVYVALFCIFGTWIALACNGLSFHNSASAQIGWIAVAVVGLGTVTLMSGIAFGSLLLADFLEARVIASDPKQVWPLKKRNDSLD